MNALQVWTCQSCYLVDISSETTWTLLFHLKVATSLMIIKVSVQLCTYADNEALPAFARRTPLLQLSISVFYLPDPQQQTCSSGFAVAGPCCDRQTDGRTPYYFIDPAPHTTWTVPKNDNNNNKLCICIAVWRTSLILTGALIRKQVRYKVFGKHWNSRRYVSENSKDSLTMFWCSFVFLNFL